MLEYLLPLPLPQPAPHTASVQADGDAERKGEMPAVKRNGDNTS